MPGLRDVRRTALPRGQPRPVTRAQGGEHGVQEGPGGAPCFRGKGSRIPAERWILRERDHRSCDPGPCDHATSGHVLRVHVNASREPLRRRPYGGPSYPSIGSSPKLVASLSAPARGGEIWPEDTRGRSRGGGYPGPSRSPWVSRAGRAVTPVAPLPLLPLPPPPPGTGSPERPRIRGPPPGAATQWSGPAVKRSPNAPPRQFPPRW
jgi:hypothetical protein